MEHYRKSSHAVYNIKYHIVWITKYRKPVLKGDIGNRVEDLIRETCNAMAVEIISGHVVKDYVHIFVSVPPHIAVNNLMRKVKGRSSRKFLMEFKSLSTVYLRRHFWARGYFVASSGNVTDEVILKYIEQQGQQPPEGEFKV